jgi:hypothetical protein
MEQNYYVPIQVVVMSVQVEQEQNFVTVFVAKYQSPKVILQNDINISIRQIIFILLQHIVGASLLLKTIIMIRYYKAVLIVVVNISNNHRYHHHCRQKTPTVVIVRNNNKIPL